MGTFPLRIPTLSLSILTQVLAVMELVPYPAPTPAQQAAMFAPPENVLARVVRDLFADEDTARATLSVGPLSACPA